MSVRVAVQAAPKDRSSWLQLAREVEAAGFDTLYAADHPGSAPSPFVALAAAAAVTERVALGTCVLNAGMWEPLRLASEVATLDVVSGGRTILGVGAGHTPQEWTMQGLPHPPPGARVVRMIELVGATTALLGGGTTSYEGRHLTLVDAELAAPRPVQDRVPVLVGGSGTRVLEFAARQADVVGISGLVRTLPDGHRHEVDWSGPATRRTLDLIRSTATAAGRDPAIEALVQVVELTDDAASAAARIAAHVAGASAEDVLDAPYAWIGSIDEIAAKIDRFRAAGIGRYVVRPPAIPTVRQILSCSFGHGATG